MAYHSQGAFSYDFLYDMPIPLRRFNMYRLQEIKKREADEMKKAQKKSGSSSLAKPNIPRKK